MRIYNFWMKSTSEARPCSQIMEAISRGVGLADLAEASGMTPEQLQAFLRLPAYGKTTRARPAGLRQSAESCSGSLRPAADRAREYAGAEVGEGRRFSRSGTSHR